MPGQVRCSPIFINRKPRSVARFYGYSILILAILICGCGRQYACQARVTQKLNMYLPKACMRFCHTLLNFRHLELRFLLNVVAGRKGLRFGRPSLTFTLGKALITWKVHYVLPRMLILLIAPPHSSPEQNRSTYNNLQTTFNMVLMCRLLGS